MLSELSKFSYLYNNIEEYSSFEDNNKSNNNINSINQNNQNDNKDNNNKDNNNNNNNKDNDDDSLNKSYSEFESILAAAQAMRDAKQQINPNKSSDSNKNNSRNNSKDNSRRSSQQEVPNTDSRPSTSNESPFELFQREMDDATIRIDMTLREATKVQNLDLDKQYGIERKTKSIFSRSMRALDDRNLRMQAMVNIINFIFFFIMLIYFFCNFVIFILFFSYIFNGHYSYHLKNI